MRHSLAELFIEASASVRRVLRTPAVAGLAVLSLSLGLGITTAVYSTVRLAVWPAPVFDEAERLAVLTDRRGGVRPVWSGVASELDFQELRRQSSLGQRLAASAIAVGRLDTPGTSFSFRAAAVTGDYFALARIPLEIGRGIQSVDENHTSEEAMVLSHDIWEVRFSSDRSIVGQMVRFGGRPFVVVGVTAKTVRRQRDLFGQAVFGDADGWVPLRSSGSTRESTLPKLTVVGRLLTPLDLPRVASEFAALGDALNMSLPRADAGEQPERARRRWSATTLAALSTESSSGAMRAAGIGAVLVTALVLGVACANIANLILARGISRLDEFAVRRALGASPRRLVLEQCADSGVLAVASAAGGIAVCRLLLHVFSVEIPLPNFRSMSLAPELDDQSVLVAAAALLLSLLVFGLAPAVRLSRTNLRALLTKATSATPSARWRGRGALVAGQVVVSGLFTILAVASTRTMVGAAAHEPGLDIAHLAVGLLSLPEATADTVAVLEQAGSRTTGVEGFALATGLPLGNGARVRQLAQVSVPGSTRAATVVTISATPGVLNVFGVQLLRGRTIRPDDLNSDRVIISEKVATEAFGTIESVGRELMYEGPSDSGPRNVVVIGVARDTDTIELFDRRVGSVYLPMTPPYRGSLIFVGRVRANPAGAARDLALAMHRADPRLLVEFASTGSRVMAPSYVTLRAAASLCWWLAALAASLAMVGLYGVLSYLVGQRTREIGVRIALGATPGHILRLVMLEGLRPVLLGVGLAAVGGLAVQTVIQGPQLGWHGFNVDATVVAVSAGLLLGAAAAACYIPARRASLVEPRELLKHL